MDSNHIERLLMKYWSCESSVEEEEQLKRYFSQNNIPEHLLPYVPLFQYLNSHQSYHTLDEEFDQKILTTIIKVDNQQDTTEKLWQTIYTKVAAVILIMIVASYSLTSYLSNQNSQSYQADTFDNPQDAFEETKKALLMISQKIEKGRKQTQKITIINKAENRIRIKN